MAAGNASFQIEKLVGRENYNSWKFAMQALLEHEDLWDCITGTETDQKKIAKARSKIILSVDPVNYVHIQDSRDAKEAWEKLKSAFEDSGLTRKVGLLRTLVTTRMKSCETVDQYVNTIISTAHKLTELNLKVDDEWIGTLLLAGLPEEYSPMIMGIESSGTPITSDSIKTKILQDVKSVSNAKAGGSMSVLYSKRDKKFNEKMRCYQCNKPGHFAKDCHSKLKRFNKDKAKNPDSENKSDGEQKKCFYALCATNSVKNDEWYIDSCASSHIVNGIDNLEHEKECSVQITTASNYKMNVDKVGNKTIKTLVRGKTNEICVQEVLRIPDAAANLLSVSKIVEKGHSVTFDKRGCTVNSAQGEVLAEGVVENGIYKIATLQNQVMLSKEVSATNANLWHRRLGHLNRSGMMQLRDLATGYDLQNTNKEPCLTCIKGKHARQPFHTSGKRASAVLELIHSDLCGPMETESIGGSRYCFTLIDDYSKKVFVYFLKEKSEVPETFLKFKNYVENQMGKQIKILRTDNGKEYVNRRLRNIVEEAGIRHQFTVPYSPQQNGTAERMNRTIIEKARTMLSDANLPKEFWAEAVSTAVYLINRCPAAKTKITPHESWTGEKPNLSNLRVFGSKVMAHIPDEKRKKWDEKSKAYTFIGYCDETKGYKLIDENKKIIVSRDVIWFESEANTDNNASERRDQINNTIFEVNGEKNTEEEPFYSEEEESSRSDEEEEEVPSVSDTSFNLTDSSRVSSSNEPNVSPNVNLTDSSRVSSSNEPNVSIENDEVRRSYRIPKPKVFDDYYTYLSVNNEPLNVQEALNSEERDKWLEAMKSEYKSLIDNNTWTLVNKPKNRTILNSRWVFKKKSGDVERYKARLVAKGYNQTQGIDYEETYSPVVRYTSLRFIFALAAKYKMHIHHMDVNTAYLQADLEDDVYIKQPDYIDVIDHEREDKVLKLNKAIYGLKQSGRAWNKLLTTTLKEMGFIQNKADQCVFYKKSMKKLIIITVYVDDLLICANDLEYIENTKQCLMNKFSMKDLGEVKNILGIHVNRNTESGHITLDQMSYIKSVLEKYNMKDCNPVSTPLDPNQKLEDYEQGSTIHVPYQEAIGCLLYIAQCTRPDISFATNVLSRYSQKPSEVHWKAVKRVFRYLKGTLDKKLIYEANMSSELIGYSDSDWANQSNDRHSTSGYVFILQGGAISWASKKQHTTALSTTEAEYMALSATCQEVSWLQNLITEIDPILTKSPTVIYCDNKGAVDLAQTSAYKPRTKHIDVRHHFIKEKIEQKEVSVRHMATDMMVADSLTKPLFRKKTEFCTGGMGVKNI